MTRPTVPRGAVAWMVHHPVTANLLMAILIIGGLLVGTTIKQEVFPEFELDLISISVPYPGASPSEVEQSVVLAVEEAVRGLDGVKKVTSRSREGVGSVSVELLLGTDGNKALQDVKNAVDRITSFPEEAERPLVSLATARREVVTVVIYGDQDEHVLRALAEKVREDLLASPGITYTELSGVRPFEIAIEIPQGTLRRYGLTLRTVADEVARTAVELPGGGIKSDAGEVLLRTRERRDLGHEFADITLVSTGDGTEVRLGDIAEITDGFSDTEQSAQFNGEPAVMVKVFRVGDETPVGVADAVRAYIDELRPTLPPGVSVELWRDWSEIYRDRINLLLRNAALGLILVLITLGLFLEIRLAFWVTMGIPTSIVGSLLFMALLDVSINMISLFAFILTLGIVVDDAIVVGENIYEERTRGSSYMAAAIDGARGVVMPVTFSVLTNIAAFFPLLLIPGIAGKLFGVLPSIIIPVFSISLVESIFILPAHLGHQRPARSGSMWYALNVLQRGVDRLLGWFIGSVYRPVQELALSWRYVTLALGLSLLVLTVGLVAGGRIGFRFMPYVEGDQSVASLQLAYGIPVATTREVVDRLVTAARDVIDEFGGMHYCRGILAQIGSGGEQGGGPAPTGGGLSGGHLANVQVYLVPSDKRPFTAAQLTTKWRERVGEIPGLETLTFQYNIGPSTGSPIDVQLRHTDIAVLEEAAVKLARQLDSYAGIRDIDDGFTQGKPQLNFRVTDGGRSLGLRPADLGRQVRDSFYGAEALRQQRGRNEVKVMVRLPERERQSEYDMEELMVRTPAGGELPLAEAATVERGRAYTEIVREDGQRVISVTADIVEGQANPGKILADLTSTYLPGLCADTPGLSYSFEGEQREQRDSMRAMGLAMVLVLIMVYGLLAIPFDSYLQPLIVMVSIPFGVVGAMLGHMLMGFDISIISLMGIVALSGVVVNDSLVLIDATNGYRSSGLGAFDAVATAGQRRFRPILLTSLTTFFGLMPMIFETSVQARFLVPMAVSLGYGIIFATGITLLLVPSLYLVLEDLRRLFGVADHRAGDDEDGCQGSSSTMKATSVSPEQ